VTRHGSRFSTDEIHQRAWPKSSNAHRIPVRQIPAASLVARRIPEIPAQQRHPVVRDGGYIFLERIANSADRSPPPLSSSFVADTAFRIQLPTDALQVSSAQLPIIRSFCGGR
jgi:hypothetical protein